MILAEVLFLPKRGGRELLLRKAISMLTAPQSRMKRSGLHHLTLIRKSFLEGFVSVRKQAPELNEDLDVFPPLPSCRARRMGGPLGFACGELASVARFNSERPKVSVFLRTAFLDQHPRRFGAHLSFPQTGWLPWQGRPGFRTL